MSNNYHAKGAYKDDDVAGKYDEERFINLKGKVTNYLERSAVYKALSVVKEESKLLDVPCGTGRATEWLLKKGHKVSGFDISEEMIVQAKNKLAKYPNLEEFYVGDAAKINIADNTFDCVVSVRLMGHVPPDERVRMLSEFKRLSKEYVIVTFYHSFCVQGIIRKIKDLFTTKKRSMWFPTSKGELKKEFAKAGLHVISIYPILKYVSETWVVLARKD